MMNYIIRRLISEATSSSEEVRKSRYSSIPKEDFQKIVSFDPTATEGKMGKYSNWLLGLHLNGRLRDEDLYKANEYLSRYDEDPKKYPRLSNIKDLQTLYKIIYGDTQRSKKEVEIPNKDKDAEFLYRDSEWILLSPKTQEASCKYGAGTQWCTAATKSNNAFDSYSERGKLYILIDRKNNRKWQIHPNSLSFRDESDGEASLSYVKYIKSVIPKQLELVLDDLVSKNITLDKYNDLVVFGKEMTRSYGFDATKHAFENEGFKVNGKFDSITITPTSFVNFVSEYSTDEYNEWWHFRDYIENQLENN